MWHDSQATNAANFLQPVCCLEPDDAPQMHACRPVCQCRAVITALAEREGWSPGYAYDGQKTLYAPAHWNHLLKSSSHSLCSKVLVAP